MIQLLAIALSSVSGVQSTGEVFKVRADFPDAMRVQIAGDLHGWSKPQEMHFLGNGAWSYSSMVSDKARIEYKLIVDGTWTLDPSNSRKCDNGIGGENSVFTGKKYKSTLYEYVPRHPLRRITFAVDDRDITVYAPRNSKGLPIIVYADGQNYEKYGKIQNVVANLIELKKIEPLIVVCVPPKDRMREYGIGWRAYAKMLFDHVLPRARNMTSASSRAEDLFVGGSSMGGVVSLRLAEEFPNLIAGGVHSQSGAFLKISNELDLSELIKPNGFGKLAKTTKLWLCYGQYEQELTRSNVDAIATLKAIGRAFGTQDSFEGHTWTSWRNRMVSALIYLFPRRG